MRHIESDVTDPTRIQVQKDIALVGNSVEHIIVFLV